MQLGIDGMPEQMQNMMDKSGDLELSTLQEVNQQFKETGVVTQSPTVLPLAINMRPQTPLQWNIQ